MSRFLLCTSARAGRNGAAHALALRVIGRANLEIEGMHRFDRQGQRETMVEVARLSNAAGRLMQTYQQGALALTTIRHEGLAVCSSLRGSI